MPISYDGTGQPCRFCGDPSWTTDEHGSIHRCCLVSLEAGDRRCQACGASRDLKGGRYRYRDPDAD